MNELRKFFKIVLSEYYKILYSRARIINDHNGKPNDKALEYVAKQRGGSQVYIIGKT